MSERTTIAVIAEGTARALLPILEILEDPEVFSKHLLALGWNLAEIPSELGNLAALLEDISDLLDEAPIDDTDLPDLLTALRSFFDELRSLKDAPSSSFPATLDPSEFKATFPQQLAGHLFVQHITSALPVWAGVLRGLGLIEVEDEPESGTRPAYTRKGFRWSDFELLVSDPKSLLESAYQWGSTSFRTDLIVAVLMKLASGLGFPVKLENLPASAHEYYTDGASNLDTVHQWALRIPLFEDLNSGLGTTLGISLLLLPGPDKPGFGILPYSRGSAPSAITLSDSSSVEVLGDSDLSDGPAILIRPEQAVEILEAVESSIAAGSTPPSANELGIGYRIESTEDSQSVIIGSDGGSRIEADGLTITIGARALGDTEAYVELKIEDVVIIFSPGNGEADSFLASLLPEDAIESGTSLRLGLSSKGTLYFGGSSALEIALPICVDTGSLKIDSAMLSVRSGPGIEASVTVNVSAGLGPLSVDVQETGFWLGATFSADLDGNLGPVDLELGFKPPTGVDLSIDSQGFSGGGFLYLDNDKGEYSGGLDLKFQDFLTVSALGIITTGASDFSLLIIISTEFTPIQLGFGFTLNGVGGLLGYNRSMDLDELRDGVKSGSLDNVLFPTDIATNASSIIDDISAIFPLEDDQFVFGPMAKIGWGTPTLITVEMGLLIEVPDPVQIAILGVLKTLLPDEDLSLLRLQVNFLGTIDFEEGLISFDASIYDSKLLTYTLSGDMAFRLSWGSNPNFLLSVGGFHPDYDPPPLSLPDMDRLTIKLLSGNNPRLTIETYFAVTSNTVQFGSKVEVYAEAWKIYVHGYMSFDALFQFSPFWFTTDISAMVDVGMGKKTLMCVSLSLDLEGPTPWKAKGKASFKVCGVKVSVDFNKTFGDSKDTALPDIEVMPELKAALNNRSNWLSELPDRTQLAVTLNEIAEAADEIVAHPGGILQVSQKVVPLDTTIELFGAQSPSDANRFEIKEVRTGSQDLSTSTLKQYFAPAQYEEMSNAQKLSRQSFEQMPSGVEIKGSSDLASSKYVNRTVEHEAIVIDERSLSRIGLIGQDLTSFHALLNGASSARMSYSHAKTSTSALAPDSVSVQQEGYSVVSTQDLTLFDETSSLASEAEAHAYVRDLIAQNSSLSDQIQVVPNYEVNQV